jgi:hypothetical protein
MRIVLRNGFYPRRIKSTILQRERGDDFEGGGVRRLQEGPYEVVSKTPLHRMVRQVKDTLADINN